MSKCNRKGCEHEARWMPVLELRPKMHNGKPARAVISIGLCEACKVLTTLDDLVTKEGWAQIVRVFDAQRKARPHREATVLIFKEIK